MKKISMIGCGKLGKDCAEVMAETYNVLGFDVVSQTPKNFLMTESIKDAVLNRDIIFVAVPTPHDPIYDGSTPTSHLPNKDFDYSTVESVLSDINQYVNKTQLVVLISTVLPGTIRSKLIDCIPNARFIYNPYLIAMGSIKWDMVNPEMIIIGTEDGTLTSDALELIEFYKPLMKNNPRIEVGTWDEAESIKIFYNTFISAKISLVNMIQDVAEANGNINVDVVTEALAKSTQRIMGPGYMKAGMGDGGACHPRDNIALRFLAEKLDLGYDLFDSIMTAREKQAEKIANRLMKEGKKICIVGKAYKPGVHYTIGSSSMLVGHYVEKLGGELEYYDINTGDTEFPISDAYLIGYWEQWVEDIEFPENCVVIDPWRRISPSNKYKIVHYGNTRNT
jgi:UDPglucose 6-dehydrogenase